MADLIDRDEELEMMPPKQECPAIERAYECGKEDMFVLLTNILLGQPIYFKDHNIIYSKLSGEYMPLRKAFVEFTNVFGHEARTKREEKDVIK